MDLRDAETMAKDLIQWHARVATLAWSRLKRQARFQSLSNRIVSMTARYNDSGYTYVP